MPKAQSEFLTQLYADQKDVPHAALNAQPRNPKPVFAHPRRPIARAHTGRRAGHRRYPGSRHPWRAAALPPDEPAPDGHSLWRRLPAL
ncbi:hypothetical protein [Lacticaseibacillus sharpeae]|uniref:hypothetical protein n=1 Tax=Lacticaseibacillus sharpeae TaxID=1626 RepID=UPI00138F4D9D|nr:hypothetical protein [Lacticaseibacillus sharpeae]